MNKIQVKSALLWLVVTAVITGAVYTGIVFWPREEEPPADALRRIRERGYIIALTDRNTLNYFVYRGAPRGYQLDLLESFGDYLGVPVKIVACDNARQLMYYMRHNVADILAMNLPVTSHGRKMVRFTDPLGETRMVLVQRKPGKFKEDTLKPVRDMNEFPGDTVWAAANPFEDPLWHTFRRKTGRKAVVVVCDTLGQDGLLLQVASGKIRYALCQENVAMVYHRNYPHLDISLLAFPRFSHAWGLPPHSDSLQREVNEWLKKERGAGRLKHTYLSYYQNNLINQYVRSDYFSVNGGRLSPFDEAIRRHSRIIMWDWRLVASLVYQESNFKTGLISKQNASGLMQLMPDINARFGVDVNSPPSEQIAAGVKYLRQIDALLPEDITHPIERVFFILATYNVGIGKVLAARERAGQYGRDMNRWNRHVDYYLSRKSRRDPVGTPDTLQAQALDYQTDGFVDDVVTRYFHYRNLVK